MPKKHFVDVAPDSSRNFALILAGGVSSRLYPFNKVLSDLTGTGRTLLQQSFDRVAKPLSQGAYRQLVDRDNVCVLTNEAMALPIRSQLNLPSSRIFVDPERRGTWPAILWAMAHLRRQHPEAVLSVLTSDHVIPRVNDFRAGVAHAIQSARQQAAILMLGVTPTRRAEDWRGFGCFRMGKSASGPTGRTRARAVLGFEEKPSLERAAEFIEEGGWVWNAGMFFFRIDVAEQALRRYQPAMARIYEAIAEALRRGNHASAVKLYKQFPTYIPHPYNPERLVDNTIDYALIAPLVREPSGEASALGVANALPEWTDLGEWTALRKLVKPDSRGNVKVGRVTASAKTRGCILVADRGLTIEVHGLKDFMVMFANGTAVVLPVQDASAMRSIAVQSREQGKEKILFLGGGRCEVRARGGRVVVHGASGLQVQLQKNRLRVVSEASLL
jgi:mannose-1-phosphate guanylyltransferase